jgi:prolipoprotein diacylglyceryltransferase
VKTNALICERSVIKVDMKMAVESYRGFPQSLYKIMYGIFRITVQQFDPHNIKFILLKFYMLNEVFLCTYPK